MANRKIDFLNFINNAITLNKGIAIGVKDTSGKDIRVITVNQRHERLKDYKNSFDALYDENLVNKVFKSFQVFAIKEDDGIPFSIKDLLPEEHKESEKKEEKKQSMSDKKSKVKEDKIEDFTKIEGEI